MLKFRKKKNTLSLKKLLKKTASKLNKTKLLVYPSNFKNCIFQVTKLKQYLESSTHETPNETVKLQQSYLTRNIDFLTKTSKVKQNPTMLRCKCSLFF